MEKFKLYATITKWGEDDFSIEFIEAPKDIQNKDDMYFDIYWGMIDTAIANVK